MAIITSTLFLFVLHAISCYSSASLSENGVHGPKEHNPLLQPSKNSNSTAKYFQQKVDHFDKSNENTWRQKYYEEAKYYATGGPVYLVLEHGRFPSPKTISNGYWHSHGKDKKAMLFHLSHRYYDFLMPITSTENENLIYLHTKQALEDFAAFIKAMNKQHNFPQGTKWIVFGSSYAGNLAAWLRAKYPDLVYGAVASSALVLAKVDCPEYLKNVGNTLEKHNEKCKADIALANTELDKLVQTSKGRNEIKKIFKLCMPLDGHQNNISFFATTVTQYVSDAVKNDFQLEKVKKICQTMLKDADKKKPIRRYSAVVHMLANENSHTCLRTNYWAYTETLKSTNHIVALFEGKFWLYQQCHEFGWFHSSDKKSSIFSKHVDLKYLVNLCSEIFGSKINKNYVEQAATKTNTAYGGLTINTPRTLFVNGDTDSWNFAQVTSNKDNKNVDVITIKGGCHSSDVRHGNSKNKEIVRAIKQIKNKLNDWLK